MLWNRTKRCTRAQMIRFHNANKLCRICGCEWSKVLHAALRRCDGDRFDVSHPPLCPTAASLCRLGTQCGIVRGRDPFLAESSTSDETPPGAHRTGNVVLKAARQLGICLLGHTDRGMMCGKRRIGWQRDLALLTSLLLCETSDPPAFRGVPGFEFRWVPKCGGSSDDSSTCCFVGRTRGPAFRWVPGFAFRYPPGFAFRWVPGFAFGWVPECGACADAAWQAEDVARGTQNPIRCAEDIVLARRNSAFDTLNTES